VAIPPGPVVLVEGVPRIEVEVDKAKEVVREDEDEYEIGVVLLEVPKEVVERVVEDTKEWVEETVIEWDTKVKDVKEVVEEPEIARNVTEANLTAYGAATLEVHAT
jgi:hypothetical protein